jgi:hypothetical protein
VKITDTAKSFFARARGTAESPRANLSETFTLIRRYVVQETLTPLRTLGRLLAYGLAGALLSTLGLVFALIGVLRVLETETGSAFAGNWAFAPYLLTAAVGAAVIGLLVLVGLRSARRFGSGALA